MNHWNIRVVRTVTEDGDWFSLREVYYGKKGRPKGWTKDAVGPHGETLDEVRQYHAWCGIALTRPVLTERNIDGKDVLVEEE